jgi:cytochrome b561
MKARYTATAISLHWLIALGFIAMFGLGLYMTEMPFSPAKLRTYSWHKWAGVSIFLLVLLRLAWRLTHRPPALPLDMPVQLRLAAHVTHVVLYLLMLAVPLSGWLMSSAMGFQTVWFGVLPLPDLLAQDRELGRTLVSVHVFLNYAMAVLVAMHAAAALKHHLLDRDDVLTRMLPCWRASQR